MEIILPANELVFVVFFAKRKEHLFLQREFNRGGNKLLMLSNKDHFKISWAKIFFEGCKKKTFKEKYIIITADTIGLHST